jgi:predicted nucleic acid-binding protein
MYKVIVENRLVLSSYIIDELFDVVTRKFEGKIKIIDTFLNRIPYELVNTPKKPTPRLFDIRDPCDYPILYSAVVEDIDVFISGDKDFDGLRVEGLEILSPAQFLEKY